MLEVLARRRPPPGLSETKGDYDGRWLFVNEMNGRIARIDLRDFKTKQIIGPVPNISGNHASSFVTPTPSAAVMGSQFSIPIPRPSPASTSRHGYRASSAGIKIDAKSGEMSLGWEIMMPPFDYDLGDAGKNVSDGWVFFLLQRRARHRQAQVTPAAATATTSRR